MNFDSGEPIIIGRGVTQPGGRPHAETLALERAGVAANGATMYVTLEPCSHRGKTPPCADAIAAAGIARVVSALEDPNPEVSGRGHAVLRAAGVAVEIGLGASEARRTHAGHIRRVCEGRPQVTLKLAISADGKVALAGRRPTAITGKPARDRVHLLRAMHDAILIGIGTVLADDPLLTCRLPGMETCSPVRIVLDSALRLPLASRLAATAREWPLWAIAGTAAPDEREQALRAWGVDILRVDEHFGKADLATALNALATRGVTRVLVEGGPSVAASFLAADLVDEAALFCSPEKIGADGIDALNGLPLGTLTQLPRLTLASTEMIGQDRLEMFERA